MTGWRRGVSNSLRIEDKGEPGEGILLQCCFSILQRGSTVKFVARRSLFDESYPITLYDPFMSSTLMGGSPHSNLAVEAREHISGKGNYIP